MKDKKHLIETMPKTYWIDINSNCNLSCVMCPQSKVNFNRPKYMSIDTFKSIIDDICNNKPLIKLYMSGEPLLHKDLFEMIEYASEKNCQTMVHTNATMLSEKKASLLLSSKLTYLSISFDGCSKEVYEKLRPPANFDKVKANILRYLDLKNRSSSNGPFVSVEIIKMNDTDKLIKEFVSYWDKMGVDSVTTRNCMTWIGSVDDRRIAKPKKLGYKPCNSPFQSGCILSDGTVVPCCMDVEGKMPFGNINDCSFTEIWFGEKFRQLRYEMLNNKLPKGSMCDGCDNTILTSRSEKIKQLGARVLSYFPSPVERWVRKKLRRETRV